MPATPRTKFQHTQTYPHLNQQKGWHSFYGPSKANTALQPAPLRAPLCLEEHVGSHILSVLWPEQRDPQCKSGGTTLSLHLDLRLRLAEVLVANGSFQQHNEPIDNTHPHAPTPQPATGLATIFLLDIPHTRPHNMWSFRRPVLWKNISARKFFFCCRQNKKIDNTNFLAGQNECFLVFKLSKHSRRKPFLLIRWLLHVSGANWPQRILCPHQST